MPIQSFSYPSLRITSIAYSHPTLALVATSPTHPISSLYLITSPLASLPAPRVLPGALSEHRVLSVLSISWGVSLRSTCSSCSLLVVSSEASSCTTNATVSLFDFSIDTCHFSRKISKNFEKILKLQKIDDSFIGIVARNTGFSTLCLTPDNYPRRTYIDLQEENWANKIAGWSRGFFVLEDEEFLVRREEEGRQ